MRSFHRGRATAAVTCRLVGGACEHARAPVPGRALVFQVLRLGAFPAADVTHATAPGADASGRYCRTALSRPNGPHFYLALGAVTRLRAQAPHPQTEPQRAKTSHRPPS